MEHRVSWEINETEFQMVVVAEQFFCETMDTKHAIDKPWWI